jgi:hypothetical protein
MEAGTPEHLRLAEPPQIVIAFGDRRLIRPRRSQDCTCLFCGLFRSHHYRIRAVLATALVPGAFWLVHDVDTVFKQQRLTGGAVVGALLLVATGTTVLALSTWYQPLRRLLHRRKPRSTAWPPPAAGSPANSGVRLDLVHGVAGANAAGLDDPGVHAP